MYSVIRTTNPHMLHRSFRFLTPLVLFAVPPAHVAAQPPKLIAIAPTGAVEAAWQGRKATVKTGQRLGPWTLMAVIEPERGAPMAVFENFARQAGVMLFAGMGGAEIELPKTQEPTGAEPSVLYLGHKLEEVLASEHDLLGAEILKRPGDPAYGVVASALPPINTMRTHNFVGTHESRDKVGFAYGGRTAHFDPSVYVPAIRKIRQDHKVWDGLVGGWLPVIRFVYPETDATWSEMIAFAPPRMENSNDGIQPVWYRVSRIENGELKWARHFDSYHPFPPRQDAEPVAFYSDLYAMRAYWQRAMAPAARIETPDLRLADMVWHSLVRDMITRIGAHPKYGVYDKEYGGPEHDGFPDTFNADTTAMLEWGLFGLARDYIENYFTRFVRDDGSILYRGPETGQYGRMLTVLAQYASYTGDEALLLRLRHRIDAVANILLGMRRKSLTLPKDDPAYGMLAGWSEADSCLDPDPPRYMQPYFGNSTEAARGFRDLGRVWRRIAARTANNALGEWGRSLENEAAALRADLQRSISRSVVWEAKPPYFPGIPGVKEDFLTALQGDAYNPQYRSYRTYMEMLFSGNLTRDQVRLVVNTRAAHKDTFLGIPGTYGYNRGAEMGGFLSYGHAYGLVQHDFTREYLLLLWSITSHQYTRGAWVAPETRNIGTTRPAAPYCTPAQLVVPLMARWMLVFEDPESDTVWLAKATPRNWLENGNAVSIAGAPTRFGRVGFRLKSRLAEDAVDADITLPPAFPAAVKLRCRAPEGYRMAGVTLNGAVWSQFDAAGETVTLPAGASGRQRLVIRYQKP